MIKIHEFKQWSVRLSDGTDCDCDTLEEATELIARVFQDGSVATIRKNSHSVWFDHKQKVDQFNKEQAQKSIV